MSMHERLVNTFIKYNNFDALNNLLDGNNQIKPAKTKEGCIQVKLIPSFNIINQIPCLIQMETIR